jgi:hypothetical protein
LFVGKLTKIENAGQRFDKIAASVPKRTIKKNLTTLSTSIDKSIYMYMYVWYLPEFLLMIAEEDVVNKLVKHEDSFRNKTLKQFPANSQGKY